MLSKNRRVYVVTSGMCGYMPDQVDICQNKAMAQDVARSIANNYREDDYSVSGNANNGYTCTPKWSDHPQDSYIEIAEMPLGMYFNESNLADMTLATLQDRLNDISL